MLYQLSYQSCYSAATRDRTRDLQIFSLTLSQLSYIGEGYLPKSENQEGCASLARKKKKKGAWEN